MNAAAAAALPSVAGIPIGFIVFACTLAGVALFHHHVLKIALTGLAVIALYKLLFAPFATGAGVPGLLAHLGHEWVIIANVFALLVGFALLSQGGYDWGFLAYAVGFGDSMIWFGSSAGVALSNVFPEARSVGQWLRHGWHVAVGSVLGFAILPLVWGWHPEPLRKAAPVAPAPAGVQT